MGAPLQLGSQRGGPHCHGKRARLPCDWRHASRFQFSIAKGSRPHTFSICRVLGGAFCGARQQERGIRRGCQAPLRRFARTGTAGPGLDRQGARPRIPGDEPGQDSKNELPARSNGRRRRERTFSSDGRGSPVHADRMRECCQSAAGAWIRPAAGNLRETGAGRGRIVRQLLTESVVLAALGALGGYMLTAAAWKILPAVAPVSIPRLAAARADGTVFAFTLALATINGILFGIAPALRLARLKEAIGLGACGSRGAAGGRQDRVRSALVVAEVALSVMLVVVGGQLLGSFVKLVHTDPGFQAGRILASVVLPAFERYPTPAQRGLFFKRILDSVQALPGVESAGTVDALPFSGENHGGFVSGERNAPLTAEVDVAGEIG